MQGFELVVGHGTPMEIAWWQMCIRAVIIFLIGVALVRVAGRRAFGRQSSLDIVLTVLLGSNLSRALTGGSPFAATIAATAVLVQLYWVAIQLAHRSDLVGFFLKGGETVLVREGHQDAAAMRSVGVSHRDLREALRTEKIDRIDKVALATLERSGHISVIPCEGLTGAAFASAAYTV